MKPRSIFRSRRRRAALWVGPGSKPPPYAAAVLELGRGIEPGEVRQAIVEHAPACRRPAGKPCTCKPDVRLAAAEEFTP